MTDEQIAAEIRHTANAFARLFDAIYTWPKEKRLDTEGHIEMLKVLSSLKTAERAFIHTKTTTL